MRIKNVSAIIKRPYESQYNISVQIIAFINVDTFTTFVPVYVICLQIPYTIAYKFLIIFHNSFIIAL